MVIVVVNRLARLCARLFRLTAIEQGVNGCVDGVMRRNKLGGVNDFVHSYLDDSARRPRLIARWVG